MIKKLLLTLASIIILSTPTFAFDLQSSPFGMTGINTSSEMQQYLIPVGKKIISNFQLPDTNENYSTIVQFKIDQKGKLSDLKIIQSSGNQDYDNRVLSAVKKSAPFPTHNFDEYESDSFLLNMDLGIIKLIKMLSELSPELMNMDLEKMLEPTQNKEKVTPGKKFINPYDIEKGLE